MGVDLIAGGRSKKSKRECKSPNIYLRLLIKLYTFLVRRTNSNFNKLVLKRLKHSRNTKRPVPLSKIVKILAKRDQSKKSYIACVVGPVLNDNRMLEIPKIRVCALKFSESAKKRILEAGGEVYTFDQLATISPEGKGTILLRGNTNTKVKRRFGTPGASGSHAVPKTSGQKGNKFERARGRRKSKAYKVKS